MARSGSGNRKRRLIHTLDYDCVERFRLRRLLAFLRLRRYDGAFEALSKETKVLFRGEHLQHLVQEGLWSDAISYVYRFVPAVFLPDSARFLVKFIRFVSCVSHYKPHGCSDDYNPYSPLQIRLHGGVSPGGVKLALIIASVRSEKVWRSINWQLVRLKASEIVGDLVAQIPEFNDMRRLPLFAARPANVLPIGLRGHRGVQKKSLGRVPADALARSFLYKKRLLFSSQGTSHSGSPVTMTRLAGLIEECLQAGKWVVHNDNIPIKSFYNEGDGIKFDPPHNEAKEIAMRSQAFALRDSVENFCHLFAGKAMDPEVECKLRVTLDLLNEIVPRDRRSSTK